MHKDGRKILSDEELAVLAANGDDKSMARLISAVSPIARAKASKFAKAGIPDDVIQGIVGWESADMCKVYKDIDVSDEIGKYFKDGEIVQNQSNGLGDL